MNEDLKLLEFLRYILNCTYISDLRKEPYNTKARIILKHLKLYKYSDKEIWDTFEYIYSI